MNKIQPTTIQAAIKSDSPALALIAADNPINAKAVLTLLICDIVKNLNVGKTMSDFQIAQTVDLILNDEVMKSLKPDDFKLCFQNALKGKYGKTYDRIDSLIIFEWLNIYIEERISLVQFENDEKHEHHKNPKFSKDEINIEGVNKFMRIAKSALIEAENEKKQKESIKIIKKESFRNTISAHQEMLNEFDLLFKTNGFEERGIRWLRHEGRVFNQMEFVEYKILNSDVSTS